MKVSREFIIGVVVIVVIALLYFGVSYLKGINLFSRQQTYYAMYDDVMGLTGSNPVILNGYKIGLVSKVGLSDKGDGKIVVEMLLSDSKLNIPKDTRFEIYSPDFFGGKAVRLLLGDSTVLAADKDTLVGTVKEDFTKTLQKEFEPLKQKTQDLITGVDKVVTNLNKVFADTAAQGLPIVFESLQRTVSNVERTSEELSILLADNRGKLSDIFSHVESITENLKNNNQTITAAIQNIKNITDTLSRTQLAGTIRKTESAMTQFSDIMSKINSGQGSLGMLVNNDTLHTQLVNASTSLDKLLDDMKAHPGRYVNFALINRKSTDSFSKEQLKAIREEIDKALQDQKEGGK